MAAPFFGTTLTDLGRNITDRGMVDVAQQQAQQAYLAQLAATRAQERNVGTQMQANRDIAQMQNESRVAHERAIQQLNTERNALLGQQIQATTDAERNRVSNQLAMLDKQIAAQQQMFAAQAYLSALGGGQQNMAPGVAQELMKAQLEAGKSADEVNRQRSIYQEMVDREVLKGATKRTWLGVIPTPFTSDARDRLSKLVDNPEFSSKFVLQDVADPETGQSKVTVVPREGVIPTIPSTTRPQMSTEQMGAFFNTIMSIFGQGGGSPQVPGVSAPVDVPQVPAAPVVPDMGGIPAGMIPNVLAQYQMALNAVSPIQGAGQPFADPYANNPLAAWVRAMRPEATVQPPVQSRPEVSRAGFSVMQLSPGEQVSEMVVPWTGATAAPMVEDVSRELPTPMAPPLPVRELYGPPLPQGVARPSSVAPLRFLPPSSGIR